MKKYLPQFFVVFAVIAAYALVFLPATPEAVPVQPQQEINWNPQPEPFVVYQANHWPGHYGVDPHKLAAEWACDAICVSRCAAINALCILSGVHGERGQWVCDDPVCSDP